MSPLVPIEVLGWIAAALTLATFVCRDMLRLRLRLRVLVLVLAANMAFIGYGLGAGLWPVATLHMLLVPVNLRRLMELRQARPGGVAGAQGLRQMPAAASGAALVVALGTVLGTSLGTTVGAAAAAGPARARTANVRRAAPGRNSSSASPSPPKAAG